MFVCVYGVLIVFMCVCVYLYGVIIVFVCVYGVIIVFVCVYGLVIMFMGVFMCMFMEWSLCLRLCVQVGTQWSSVVDKCCRGHYQPLLLLYATPNDSAISLESAPNATVMVNSEYCFNKNNSGRIFNSV